MAIYIGLIVYILALPVIVGMCCKDQEKKNKYVTLLGMLAIFLLLALKGDVGSDISGYLSQYEIAANKAWDDYEYVYFENGYIFLMKVFNAIGASFQWFMVCVYALACIAMYIFIRKYSKNPSLSMLIFICYDFFVFYISGVRQTLAMSICLIAYVIFEKRKFVPMVAAVGLTYLATLVHQSALVFFLAFILALIPMENINIVFYAGAIVASFFFKSVVWDIVNTYVKEVGEVQETSLGGNFILLIGVSLIMYLMNSKKNILGIKIRGVEIDVATNAQLVSMTRMMLASVSGLVLFSGHSMTRAVMYGMMFIIVGLPNTLEKFEYKIKVLLQLLFIAFFVALFYFETLEPNLLELVPYKFFWE